MKSMPFFTLMLFATIATAQIKKNIDPAPAPQKIGTSTPTATTAKPSTQNAAVVEKQFNDLIKTGTPKEILTFANAQLDTDSPIGLNKLYEEKLRAEVQLDMDYKSTLIKINTLSKRLSNASNYLLDASYTFDEKSTDVLKKFNFYTTLLDLAPNVLLPENKINYAQVLCLIYKDVKAFSEAINCLTNNAKLIRQEIALNKANKSDLQGKQIYNVQEAFDLYLDTNNLSKAKEVIAWLEKLKPNEKDRRFLLFAKAKYKIYSGQVEPGRADILNIANSTQDKYARSWALFDYLKFSNDPTNPKADSKYVEEILSTHKSMPDNDDYKGYAEWISAQNLFKDKKSQEALSEIEKAISFSKDHQLSKLFLFYFNKGIYAAAAKDVSKLKAAKDYLQTQLLIVEKINVNSNQLFKDQIKILAALSASNGVRTVKEATLINDYLKKYPSVWPTTITLSIYMSNHAN